MKRGRGRGRPSIAILKKGMPTAPKALEASELTDTSFRCEWLAGARASAYYLEVYQGDEEVFSGSVGNVTSYEIEDVDTIINDYRYRVRSINDNGTSRFSRWVEVTSRKLTWDSSTDILFDDTTPILY